jgi:hypothetical protein
MGKIKTYGWHIKNYKNVNKKYYYGVNVISRRLCSLYFGLKKINNKNLSILR